VTEYLEMESNRH